MNNLHLIRTAGIVLMLHAGLAGFGAGNVCFHVSPSGDDAADGKSSASAFRTIERARDAAHGHSGIATIVLADGVYEMESPLAFTEKDHDLVFEAAHGARPVVSAGRRIAGWRVGADGWWRTKVAPGEKFAQFYVNGQRRTRPFLPRQGYYYAKKGASPDPATGKTRFIVREGHFPQGENPAMEVCMFNVWTMSRSHVVSYDPSARMVSLDLPSGKRDFDTIGPGRWYRYDNVKTALGEPGDWYLDAAAGEIVYVPMPGETPHSCETVVSRHEQAAVFCRATNIVWRGVTFAYADYGVKPGGNYTGQAASGQPGAVQVESSSGIRFERCAVVHTGAHGIEFIRGSENCAVVDCELRDLGAGGIKIGDKAAKGRLVRGCEVRGCLISEGGRVDPAGCGVWIGHATDNLVSHNTIRDMYYTGVSAGWNWSFAQTARDNVIEWNHIHDIGRHVLSDMGGIYLLGRQPGTVERFNHIHDVTRARNCAFGIYFDSGTSFVTVTNNVVHDCEDSNFFLAAISASNRVENNIFAFGPSRQLHAASRNPSSSPTLFTRNIVAWDDGVHSQSLPDEKTIELSGNMYWCPEDSRPKTDPRGGAFVRQPFVDPKGRDLRLADGNAAREAGFKPFSLDGCGRIAPPSLTADMPKVPDVFFPAPEPIIEDIAEDFEETPVGAALPGWSVLPPDGTNTIRVTERFAAGGKRSLEIVDDKKDWRPHFYRSLYRPKGRWRISFALRVEDGAQPRIELRGDEQGLPLLVRADGMLVAPNGPLVKIEEGKWHAIAMSLTMGKDRTDDVCTVTVAPQGGAVREFSVSVPRKMHKLQWIGVHSCGAKGRYYIDDIAITEEGRRK